MSSKKLVIVESPAKVKTISKFLGNGYIVMASYGHCFQIDPKGTSIDIENGYEPKYVPSEEKKKVIADIKSKLKSCDMVYLATDPDREGEAIAANLRDFVIKGACPIKRVTFHEITKNAILDAFKNPADIDENMYLSQKARSVVDRLVGYGVSPVLWKKVCKGTSAGRVQSIGLKIITERQKEIDSFVPEEYWTLGGIVELSSGDTLRIDYKPKSELKNESEVDAIIGSISPKKLTVQSIKEAEKKNSPSPLFKTSTLQQAASSSLGWSSKKTMQVAQALYEGFSVNGEDQTGLITYHRTDSMNVSKEAMDACRGHILSEYGQLYLPSKPRYFKTNNKSAQEAHEGIRPTHLEYKLRDVKNSIPLDAYKLYELIYAKFVSSQMTEAVTSNTTITFCSQDGENIFTYSGHRTIFDGYYKVWTYALREDSLDIPVNEGEILGLLSTAKEQHFTKAPAYFNDGSLVKVLEEEGVGRPSTYASIIDTLITRKYVSRDGKKLKGEDLGRMVSDYLTTSFPELMDYKYTSRVEEKLDAIAEGKDSWVDTVDEFYKELDKRVGSANTMAAAKQHVDTGILCPTCKKHNLILKRSKYGEFYGCSGFAEKGADACKSVFQIGENKEPVAKKEAEYLQGHVCDKCGSKISVRTATKGKNIGGKFYGCSGYPRCKRIFDENGKPQEYEKKATEEGKAPVKKKAYKKK